jgi:membrane-associated phospholipid phosphatase
MNRRPDPFWSWPDGKHLGCAALLALAMGLWFELIYGGADVLAAQHSHRVRLHLDGELAIPFVPETVLLYLSLYLLFWAAPFVLHSRRELKALTATLAVVTLCAGVCFMFLPAESAFPTPSDMGAWTGPVRFAKGLALRYNYVPSLHVALGVVCVAVFASRAAVVGKVVLWAWALAICASTLLLHQHYLIDVVTGFALGLAGVGWGYRRWTAPRPGAETPPASPSTDPGRPA